jgi:hypothetical protein
METMTTSSNANTHVNATNLAVTESTTKLAASTVPSTVAPAGRARVAISFLTEETDANLIVSSQQILVAMTGNPAYPVPVPTLADLTTARNTYIAAVNAAKDSRLAKAVRNQQRKVFEGLLRNLAYHVQVASGGDLPTLLGSGFPVQRGKQPVGPLPAPANLRLARGKISGQLIARCKKLQQAGSYEWRYAMNATPTAWVSAEPTFAAKVTLDGLLPGTQYIAQVRVQGTAGPGNWSDTAMLMVV